MELKKFDDYLKMAKAAIDEVKRPFKVKKAKKNLELRIIEIETDVADYEVEVQNILTNTTADVDWDRIIELFDDKALLERKLKQLEDLKEQLF